MASGKAFFMLRGVDSALWTAARQQAQAEGVKITDLVERLLSRYMSDTEDDAVKLRRKLTAWGVQYAPAEDD